MSFFFFKAYKGVLPSDEHNIKPYKQPSSQAPETSQAQQKQ